MKKTILLLLLSSVYSHCGIGVGKSITGTLPVELIAFSAVQNSNSIQLSWTTATEVNNFGFEVERSLNLRGFNDNNGDVNPGGFSAIGFIEGSGNSTSSKYYSFTDENITAGYYNYRLKQIDTDGSYSYSQIIELSFGEIPKDYVLNQNYPNPFNPITTIKYSIPTVETGHAPSLQHIMLKVFDLLGNEVVTLVDELKEPGNYEVEFDGSQLSSGVYLYKIQADNFIDVKKMVILK